MKVLTLKIKEIDGFSTTELIDSEGTIVGTAKIKNPPDIPDIILWATVSSLMSLDEQGILDSYQYHEGYDKLVVETPRKVFHADLVDVCNAIDLPIEFEVTNGCN